MFVFIYSSSNLLFLKNIFGSSVLTFKDKFVRFSKSLTLFNSKFTPLLIFKTSDSILLLNFVVLTPK